MKENFQIRLACKEDVASIVSLLANDPLGKLRESCSDPLPSSYYDAFTEINNDKNNYLFVVEDEDKIIGTAQLTIITHLTHQGAKRAQIEGVRIAESHRNKGVGSFMINWMINKSRDLSCHQVQLTTDKTRPQALQFYQKLGFVATHVGLKLPL